MNKPLLADTLWNRYSSIILKVNSDVIAAVFMPTVVQVTYLFHLREIFYMVCLLIPRQG